MADNDSEKEEDLGGITLLEAPVLFLVVSHKAFRAELSSLRLSATEAARGCSRDAMVDLGRRLEFFKLVYSYHCAAEDEQQRSECIYLILFQIMLFCVIDQSNLLFCPHKASLMYIVLDFYMSSMWNILDTVSDYVVLCDRSIESIVLGTQEHKALFMYIDFYMSSMWNILDTVSDYVVLCDGSIKFIVSCTQERKVIFLALDAHVINVAPTYSLEHKSIDENFNSIFHHLDLLMSSNEDSPQISQMLLFSIGTIEAMISQHMQKEEEQVFPLLRKKLSSEEQSQLVWQYICSVPTILLEDFLPWMTSYLSSNEKLDVLCCLKHIIPKEDLLLEVVLSWIQHKDISSSHAYNTHRKAYQFLNGLSSSKDILELFPLEIHREQDEEQLKEAGLLHSDSLEGPIEHIRFWHAALRREFDQFIEELCLIKRTNCFASLSSVIVQIKFIADILIFYSNCLEKIFYPLVYQLSDNAQCTNLVDENQIKGLQMLLFQEREGSVQLVSFVERLCKELESLLAEFSKKLVFLEIEVFPFISNKCTRNMQLWLLYTSLHVMPLGLLRCTVTWFSAKLPENQSTSVLTNLKLQCSAIGKSFKSLLHEWVRIGSSGKTSTEKFRQNLEEMFNGRSFYLTDHIRLKAAVSEELLKPKIATEMRTSEIIPSSSVSVTTQQHQISTPTGMDLHKFFSDMFKRVPPFQNNLIESDPATFLSLDSRPMDHVLYIHRALVEQLEYLISLSAKLASDMGFLSEFQKRFKLLENIYQIHSSSEDEIAFPALESKAAVQNVSHSYTIDHKLNFNHFTRTSEILNLIFRLIKEGNYSGLEYYHLCLKLHDTCLSMHKVLADHMCREEVEIYPLFRKHFSIQEEENIVGQMLGRIRAEILQEMIPWLMGCLTSDEQHAIISLWLKVTKYTNFSHWLREWWEGMTRYNVSSVEERSRPSPLAADPMEVVSMYLVKYGSDAQKYGHERESERQPASAEFCNSGTCNLDNELLGKDKNGRQLATKGSNEKNENFRVDAAGIHDKEHQDVIHQEHPLCISQEELEATIRRVSRDSNLDIEKKSYIIQNLLMSRWIVRQKFDKEAVVTNDKGEVPGRSASYRNSDKLIFGCKHYKRNCKLFAPCCNKLYTCIRCHDEQTDHALDRESITNMMCMKCLAIQPINPICTNPACGNFSMSRYYCRICKLFDDERQIYHCPYCNLCRVGKGLGIEYFHCMKCNACMSNSLFAHVCREKCLEENCPICHEYIFTSSAPVKALPCGHSMHSACFQEYTFSHYICPICSKSLGDMQVYFGMLDALLAEEKLPEEYAGQIQAILCNDCEKRGTTSFHFLYHKCPHCGSYNTRLL